MINRVFIFILLLFMHVSHVSSRDFTKPIYSDFGYINNTDHIVRAEVIARFNMIKKACIYDFYTVQIIETIKGGIPVGKILTVGLSTDRDTVAVGSYKLLFLDDLSSEFEAGCLNKKHRKSIPNLTDLKLENGLKSGLFDLSRDCKGKYAATFSAIKCDDSSSFVFQSEGIFELKEYLGEGGAKCQRFFGKVNVLMKRINAILSTDKETWLQNHPYDAL